MRATWLKNSIRIRLLLEEIKRIDGKLVTALMLHVVGQRHRRRYHGETTMHGTDRRQGIWQVIFVKKTLVGWAPMEDMDMMDKKWEGTSHRRWDYQHHGEGAPVTAVDQIRKIAGLLPEPPPKPPWPPPARGGLGKAERIVQITFWRVIKKASSHKRHSSLEIDNLIGRATFIDNCFRISMNNNNEHHGEGAPVTAVDQIRKIAGLLPEPPPKPPWPPPARGGLGKAERIVQITFWRVIKKASSHKRHSSLEIDNLIGRATLIDNCFRISMNNNNVISTNNNSVINNFLDDGETTFSVPDTGVTLQISRHLSSRYYSIRRGNTKSFLQCSLGDSYQEKLDDSARMNDFALASQATAEMQDAPPRFTRVVGRAV